jgi:hypothetical protein
MMLLKVKTKLRSNCSIFSIRRWCFLVPAASLLFILEISHAPIKFVTCPPQACIWTLPTVIPFRFDGTAILPSYANRNSLSIWWDRHSTKLRWTYIYMRAYTLINNFLPTAWIVPVLMDWSKIRLVYILMARFVAKFQRMLYDLLQFSTHVWPRVKTHAQNIINFSQVRGCFVHLAPRNSQRRLTCRLAIQHADARTSHRSWECATTVACPTPTNSRPQPCSETPCRSRQRAHEASAMLCLSLSKLEHLSLSWYYVLICVNVERKDVNGYNTYEFCLLKPVPNRVNQYPYSTTYPLMGRRSSPYPYPCG